VPSLLEVKGLTVRFRTQYGQVQALTDAHFDLDYGETLVLVGESGSGKTVLAHALMRLLPMNAAVEGEVRLAGEDLLKLDEGKMRAYRGQRMSLIPQSPGASLNPVRRLGALLMEAARARGLSPEEARSRLTKLLAEVGLKYQEIEKQYVHQLSGGMQQRVVNALALVGEPDLVIADEPTYGLDSDLVDVTASQLAAIAQRGAALIVITHDLRLAERLGGRLALIYASYIVELRSTKKFFSAPLHPYGRALLDALPERGGRPIPGLSPELTALPEHCPFAFRCEHKLPSCMESMPQLATVSACRSMVRCFLYAES
jgi:peptide/nickel transport system ATP-binding protein